MAAVHDIDNLYEESSYGIINGKVTYTPGSERWDLAFAVDQVGAIVGKIPTADEVKFLGIIFDRKLTFIPHIKYLKAKCLKALNIMKVVASTD